MFCHKVTTVTKYLLIGKETVSQSVGIFRSERQKSFGGNTASIRLSPPTGKVIGFHVRYLIFHLYSWLVCKYDLIFL